MKYSFKNDYSEGAHERIIEALVATNRKQTVGYGMDEYCSRAKELILSAIGHNKSEVHFLVGGTQTNFTVIASVLRPYQGVIAADAGHISVHETGAVEATGHKVITLPSREGKISAAAVAQTLKAHYSGDSAEHTVQPGMLYISQPTEMGTIYTKRELIELSDICREYDIAFFVDGARLGCALTCESNDVTLGDLAELTDIFYIGGTKMGALFGEALVINNPEYSKNFRYMIKQRGGMFAKGRLLGIQFEQLFTDNLYFELARHANIAAQKLAKGIKRLGYNFAAQPVTNQLFPVFPKDIIRQLEKDYLFEFIESADECHDVIRLCTCWATDINMVDEFLSDLSRLSKI